MRNFKASAMVSLRWVSLLENRNFQKERYKVRGHVPCDGSESIIKTCKHTSHPVNQTHESKIIYCQVRTMAGFPVQSLSRVWLFATPWITVCQASLSISNSQSLPKPMPIESVMPSSHLILCRPLLLLPSIPPSIRVFSNESALHIRWPEYWSFSFSISPSSEHPALISFGKD